MSIAIVTGSSGLVGSEAVEFLSKKNLFKILNFLIPFLISVNCVK